MLENNCRASCELLAKRISKHRVATFQPTPQGYPGREVIRQSEKLGVDLIVIGKRGVVKLEDHLLSSVTQNVLYHTDKNILLVPDNLDEDIRGLCGS